MVNLPGDLKVRNESHLGRVDWRRSDCFLSNCTMLSSLRATARLRTASRLCPAALPRRHLASATALPTTLSSALPPTVATSALLRQSRNDALSTPGIKWRDEEEVGVGSIAESDVRGTTKDDLRDVELGGRETKKMK